MLLQQAQIRLLVAINAFYLHICNVSLRRIGSRPPTPHTGFPFKNPLFYSRNKYKEKGQRSPRGEFAFAAAGSLRRSPQRTPVRLQAGAYSHSEGFHPLLQLCLSGAAAALPAAALPRAPLSGAGSEHSPRRGGTIRSSPGSQLSPVPSPRTPHRRFSGTLRRHGLTSFFSLPPPQIIPAVFQNFSTPGDF